MPRSSVQLDKIRKQRKQLIMETALKLFAEKGYHATSISQIAKRAKISKGLTYNYFESKKEILDELIEHGFYEVYEKFDLNKDGTLTEDEFIYFINEIFNQVQENTEHWKLFFSLLLQPSIAETFTKEYQEKGAPVFNMLLNFIKSRGSKDPEGDLFAVSSMLEGAFLYCITMPDFFDREKMKKSIIDASFRIINNQNSNSKSHENSNS